MHSEESEDEYEYEFDSDDEDWVDQWRHQSILGLRGNVDYHNTVRKQFA